MEYLTNKNFEKKVLQNDKPVLVDIITSHCPNCKIFDPVFEEMAISSAEKADFYKLNAEDYLSIAKRYKVLAVPTLLYFHHGTLVKKNSGIQSKSKMEKTISSIADYSAEEAKANEHKSFIQKIFGK